MKRQQETRQEHDEDESQEGLTLFQTCEDTGGIMGAGK